MKKKRMVFAVALTLMLFSSVVAMASGARNTYPYAFGVKASVYGYVHLMDGGILPDRLYYDAAIRGTQISYCTVAYSVSVGSDNRGHGVLDKSHKSASVSGKFVGIGNKSAVLSLWFNGDYKYLRSYAS